VLVLSSFIDSPTLNSNRFLEKQSEILAFFAAISVRQSTFFVNLTKNTD